MGFTYTLSKDDVAAFRKADVIVVHRRPNEDLTDFVRLVQKVRTKGTRGYTVMEHELERIVPADSTVRQYRQPHKDNPGAVSCDLHANMHDSAWNGVKQMLREGDELNFLWVAGNNSPVLDDAHVVRDELWLTVVRRNKATGQVSDGKSFRFLIDVMVGRDNSARMIGGFR